MIDLGKVLVPIPTPFRENYEIDYDKACQIAKGISKLPFVDSIIIMATSGEFTSLNFDERVKLSESVRKGVEKKPLIVGTGTTTTKETIELTKAVEEIGVDVAMIVPPYYSKPTQAEIYRYFKTIAQNTKLPIMLYNVGFTGVNIEPDTIAELSKIKNIFAVKEIGPNPLQVAETIMKSSKDFKVYSGSALLLPCILAQGGVGVVCESLIGDRVRKLIDFYLSGDIKKGLEIYFNLITFFKIYAFRTNGVPVFKYVMSLAGFDAGKPRPPLTEVTDKEKEKIKDVLKELNLI